MTKSVRCLVAVTVALTVLAFITPARAQTILKVGSTPTGIPFTFLDTKTNTIQGVMVDLVTEVGKEAGFQVQVEAMQFSTLIAALTSNKIDLISAAMYITPARREVIEFSQDRKSTRLNSSHTVISYAVFCLKKKNNTNIN